MLKEKQSLLWTSTAYGIDFVGDSLSVGFCFFNEENRLICDDVVVVVSLFISS